MYALSGMPNVDELVIQQPLSQVYMIAVSFNSNSADILAIQQQGTKTSRIKMDKLLKVDVTVDTDDYQEDVYRILQLIKPQWESKNIKIEVWFI